MSILEKRLQFSEIEKQLIGEEQFIRYLTVSVQKICKNKMEQIPNCLIKLAQSLIKRYRKIVSLQVKEIMNNKKLFYHLLKQKYKDNFFTLDKNLWKVKLKKELKKPTSKINKIWPLKNLKKLLKIFSRKKVKSQLSQDHLHF